MEMWRIVDSEFRGEGRVNECIDVKEVKEVWIYWKMVFTEWI